MNKFWIFGSVGPDNAGGVTTFVERMIRRNGEHIAGLVDAHHGRKIALSMPHIHPSRPGTAARLAVALHLPRLRSEPLLVNISDYSGFWRVMPFLQRRSAPTIAVFHHGELPPPEGLAKSILAAAVKRTFDHVLALSDRQRSDLIALGLDEARVSLVDPYIEPVYDEEAYERSPGEEQVLQWIDQGEGPLIVASGYARDYYRHDWVLRAVQDDPRFAHCRALVCCYGPTEPLIATLEAAAGRSERTHFVFGLDARAFSEILKQADIYARPTAVDSFGIALHDSAAMNIPIVASDACERPASAFLHEVDSYESFCTALEEALGARRGEGAGRGSEREPILSAIGRLLG